MRTTSALGSLKGSFVSLQNLIRAAMASDAGIMSLVKT